MYLHKPRLLLILLLLSLLSPSSSSSSFSPSSSFSSSSSSSSSSSDPQGDPALRDPAGASWPHVCGAHWRGQDCNIRDTEGCAVQPPQGWPQVLLLPASTHLCAQPQGMYMYVCMYVCMNVHVDMWVYMYVTNSTHFVSTNLHMYIHVHVSQRDHTMSICMFIRTVYTCTCTSCVRT